jgi:peptidoglycan/xylan/chitin deacetylase (PgdA/CDA1 family)
VGSLAGRDQRLRVKRVLARMASRRPAGGLTVLIYHQVGGRWPDEGDLDQGAFTAQMDLLAAHRVVALDQALAELAAGDERPKVVLTFDDGFADVHETAWPLLAARHLPFTVYLASAYMGSQLRWEGSTGAHPGRALSWPQVCELIASGLCTVGNHTHTHVAPEALTEAELDACTAAIESHTGVTPSHFAYPWGVAQTSMEPALRSRFRSAATAEVGRNRAGTDAHRLRRVPVRATDPIEFFAAKLAGHLMPERAYGAAVALAKRAGVAT